VELALDALKKHDKEAWPDHLKLISSKLQESQKSYIAQAEKIEELKQKVENQGAGRSSLPLDLQPGCSGHAAPFENPTVTRENDIAVVEGVVCFDGTLGKVLAILPEDCRPVSTRVFCCNTPDSLCRVDVSPDGEVKYVSGTRPKPQWISLAGICFRAKD